MMHQALKKKGGGCRTQIQHTHASWLAAYLSYLLPKRDYSMIRFSTLTRHSNVQLESRFETFCVLTRSRSEFSVPAAADHRSDTSH